MTIPVFVSTKETQGQHNDDFCIVPEGEIVMFHPRPCAAHPPDDTCGCDRAMTGTVSSQATTTTMRVTMFDGSLEDLDKLILKHLRDEGWVRPAYIQAIDNNFAARLSSEASKFSVGTIVEYRDGVFTARNRRNNA